MPDIASRDTGHRFHWPLWALASLMTLCFAPVAWLATHRVYDHLEPMNEVLSVLPWLTRASMWVGSHLGLIAVVLSAGAGTVIIKQRSAANFAICAQVLVFFALCALTATGLLVPFENMCFHPEGLAP